MTTRKKMRQGILTLDGRRKEAVHEWMKKSGGRVAKRRGMKKIMLHDIVVREDLWK